MSGQANAFQKYIANSTQTDICQSTAVRKEIQATVGYISNVLRGVHRRKEQGGFWKYEDRLVEAHRAMQLLTEKHGLTAPVEQYINDIQTELNQRKYFKKVKNQRESLQRSYDDFSNSIEDHTIEFSTYNGSNAVSPTEYRNTVKTQSLWRRAAGWAVRVAAGVTIAELTLANIPCEASSNKIGPNDLKTNSGQIQDTDHDLVRPTYFPPTATGTWKLVGAKHVKTQALNNGKPEPDKYRNNKHPIGDKIGGFFSAIYKSTVSQAFNGISAVLGGHKTGAGKAVNDLDDKILAPAVDFVAAVPGHAQDIVFVPTEGMSNRSWIHHVPVVGYLLPRDVTDEDTFAVNGPLDIDVVQRYRQDCACVNALVIGKTAAALYGLGELLPSDDSGNSVTKAVGLSRKGGPLRK